MTHFGSSAAGLAVSLLILAPTLLLAVARPDRPVPRARVPWVITALERIGQAGCLVLPAITGTTPGDTSPPVRHLCSVALAVALLAYYALWGRYLRSGRRLRQLYAPFAAIPVPMAVVPVLAFFAAVVWLAS